MRVREASNCTKRLFFSFSIFFHVQQHLLTLFYVCAPNRALWCVDHVITLVLTAILVLPSLLCIAIRLPTDSTVYFVYLFPLFLPYMFRALISPSSGASQAVFLYIQPFGSCGVYVAHLRMHVDWFVVLVSLPRQTSPQAHAEPLIQENHHGTSTVKPPRQTSPQAHADEQHKHHMNQMDVYKKQFEIPLMMGL